MEKIKQSGLVLNVKTPNRHHPGCSQENIDAVRQIVKDDRRMSITRCSQQLNINGKFYIIIYRKGLQSLAKTRIKTNRPFKMS